MLYVCCELLCAVRCEILWDCDIKLYVMCDMNHSWMVDEKNLCVRDVGDHVTTWEFG